MAASAIGFQRAHAHMHALVLASLEQTASFTYRIIYNTNHVHMSSVNPRQRSTCTHYLYTVFVVACARSAFLGSSSNSVVKASCWARAHSTPNNSIRRKTQPMAVNACAHENALLQCATCPLTFERSALPAKLREPHDVRGHLAVAVYEHCGDIPIGVVLNARVGYNGHEL